MKQISAITFFITVFFSLNAQFSLQGEVQKYYYAQEPNELTQIDTSLTDFEEYNFEYTDDWEYFNTSILGTAQQPLSFKWNRKKGFQDGNIFFNNYKYDIDNLRYFETEKFPYSEIFYSIGTKLEQKAGLVHAQNIKNRFKFAAELKGMSASGLYSLNQRTRNFGSSFYGIYSSKNERYKLEGNFTYSAIKVSEIGGIKEDILNSTSQNKLFYTSYLDNAINKHSTLSVSLKNSYGFGFARLDSINDTLAVKKYYPVFKLKHSIGTNIVKQSFYDYSPDSTFYLYENQYFQNIDSLNYDLKYHNIPHRIAFEYLGTKNTDSVTYRNIKAEIALQHNNLEIWQNGFEKTYNNLMLDLSITSNPLAFSAFQYKFNSSFFLAGYNKFDFSTNGKLAYDFDKFGNIALSLLYETVSPTWIENNYQSSSMNWNNNFKKKQILEANLEYNLPKQQLRFAAQVDFLNNYIYFAENTKPIQTAAKITYWNFFIQKDSKWKIWHWDNFIAYQFTNHKEILPLPALYLKTSLYAKFKLFKGNMKLSTGFDLRFNTAFKARAWNPIIAQFYVQNERTMKFTPMMDVFLSGKIKSVRFYVKLNYVNEGLFVKNNYKALDLPANGRTFSLGLSWRFFE
ncbi:MAG: putative porin [Chitinophagales bacterium]